MKRGFTVLVFLAGLSACDRRPAGIAGDGGDLDAAITDAAVGDGATPDQAAPDGAASDAARDDADASAPPPVPCATVEDETYPVYSAVLRSDVALTGMPGRLVLERPTSFNSPPSGFLISFGLPPFAQVGANLAGLRADTYASLASRGKISIDLEDRFAGTLPVSFLSKDAIADFYRVVGGWDGLYVRFPDARALSILSRVGVDATCSQALVYFGTQQRPLAGAGYYFLLEKKAGAWIVVATWMDWIS